MRYNPQANLPTSTVNEGAAELGPISTKRLRNTLRLAEAESGHPPRVMLVSAAVPTPSRSWPVVALTVAPLPLSWHPESPDP